MVEFYRLAEPVVISASVLTVLAVIALCACVFLSFVRGSAEPSRRWVFDAALMLALVLQAMLLVYRIARVQLGISNGFVVPPDSALPAYAAGGAVLALSVLAACARRKPLYLFAALASLLTAPFVQTLSGRLYPALFILAAAAETAFAAVYICAARKGIVNGVTAASVKQAIDALNTGVMFCEPGGYILLANSRILSLMRTLAGKAIRDGAVFYERISRGALENGCERTALSGGTACRLPDGTVWLFSKTGITARGRDYVQITASDVTERWRMTQELKERQSVLLARGEELHTAIANVQQLCREEESLRMKSRFHDALGHRVALLFRALSEGREPDEAILKSFSVKEIVDSVTGDYAAAARRRIDALRLALGGIGVRLTVDGDVPDDAELASLSADIITEGSTNAVRHGFATEVEVCMRREGGAFTLTVRDNGLAPQGAFREGGGLSEMRRRLSALAGALEVTASPRFTLAARVPAAGEQEAGNDKSTYC